MEVQIYGSKKRMLFKIQRTESPPYGTTQDIEKAIVYKKLWQLRVKNH